MVRDDDDVSAGLNSCCKYTCWFVRKKIIKKPEALNNNCEVIS
jgi:hypothetical protein